MLTDVEYQVEIGSQKKVIFIYDVTDSDDPLFESFLNILKENSYKTLHLDEAIKFLIQ